MKIAVGVDLTRAPKEGGSQLLRALRPIGEACTFHGWALWVREWPTRGGRSDPWVLLAAVSQTMPGLHVGVLASFGAGTRVSDLEDTLVLDNLTGGRLEVALLPSEEADRTAEVQRGLNGQALERTGSDGAIHTFRLTPLCAGRTIPLWVPLLEDQQHLAGVGHLAWSLPGSHRPPLIAMALPDETAGQPDRPAEPNEARPLALGVIDAPSDMSAMEVVRIGLRWQDWARTPVQ